MVSRECVCLMALVKVVGTQQPPPPPLSSDSRSESVQTQRTIYAVSRNAMWDERSDGDVEEELHRWSIWQMQR